MHALDFSLQAQAIFCSLAILFNSLLILVVIKTKRQEVGSYKWMLVLYASFEIFYAVTVLQAMPIHVVYDHTWIFFSFRGPLIDTPVAFLSSAIYCLFYELWMFLVVLNFIFRYVCVCRPDCCNFIKAHQWMRVLLVATLLSFLLLCVVCTIYWCAINRISPAMEKKIQEDFFVENIKSIGYTMLRLVDLQGNISTSGISATAIHAIIVFVSAVIITFCSLKIWWKIKEMQRLQDHSNVKLEKQLFRTLLLQMVVPVLLCHIPSLTHLSFAFWETFPLDNMTPFFAVFTTIPKALDPLIAFLCIGEYRSTLRRIFWIPKAKVTSSSSPGDTASAHVHMNNTVA